MIQILILFIGLYYVYGSDLNKYNIESNDIPYEYIHHLNTTTNRIDNCDDYRLNICKNSNCFDACWITRPFIEMPTNTSDTIPSIHRYILTPYADVYNSTIYNTVSLSCTKDSQCFSDRCVNNECVPNEKNNIRVCEYDKCGKFNRDQCYVDNECFSGYCNEKCTDPEDVEPRINPYRDEYILAGILGFLIFLAVVCGCICCWTQPDEFPKIP